MLPHYSAYKVAENFRMLEAFHPDRIDLGIGRSPSFRLVNKALNEAREKRLPYEQQVADLYKYLTDDTKEEHRFKDLAATPVTRRLTSRPRKGKCISVAVFLSLFGFSIYQPLLSQPRC
jgi:alkanesulfonate monooxygenase SsuD/methylene tetrahydromethanopterin reductase-like flavin-dependent oxidoreductase (luciferase family)